MEEIKIELKSYYYTLLESGKLELPSDLTAIHSLVAECDFKHDLYNCISTWYVETEVAIDTLRRIQMYEILEGHPDQ